MFLDEARVASRLRTSQRRRAIDVVSMENEVLLVMEYVHGASLAQLIRARASGAMRVPAEIIAPVMRACFTGYTRLTKRATKRGARSASCIETFRRRTSSWGSTACLA